MKPILLLNIGTAFSATTPFFYTLALDNKYFHTGHIKAHSYLYALYAKEEKLPIFKDLEDDLEEKGEKIRKKRKKSEKLAFLEKIS